MKFTEQKLENAFIELLSQEGYPHFTGESIVRAPEEVIIEADLIAYLLNRYESKKLISVV